MTASVLKFELAIYTRKQCQLWGIPIADDVGLSHGWDPAHESWSDGFADLPVEPDSGAPILLVPRRVLRQLPWINYEDFRTHHLLSYLAAKQRKRALDKVHVIDLTQRDLSLVDRYVDAKENASAEAAPINLDTADKDQIDAEADSLAEELPSIAAGPTTARRYESLVLRILNIALEPELIDGMAQERTYGGTQIRDLIFVNDSDHSFWQFVRNEHKSLLVTFEIKNKKVLEPADLNQLHAYLGDSTGYMGFIVSRDGFRDPDQKRAFTLYNRRSPRSVILSLSDQDLIDLVRWRKAPLGPTSRVREIYSGPDPV